MSSPLLLVEDTPSLSLVYQAVLNKAGYDVESALTFAEAQSMYARGAYDTILLDLILPDGDGIDLMAEILQRNPAAKIIVITANGSVNRAVEAMRAGAFDFLVKPFDDSRFLSAVANAVKATKLAEGGPAAPLEVLTEGYQGFLGSSPAMRRIYEMVNFHWSIDGDGLYLGRKRNGQRGVRTCNPQRFQSLRWSVCAAQLRGDPERPSRIGSVRASHRILHRCNSRQERCCRNGEWRHALSR